MGEHQRTVTAPDWHVSRGALRLLEGAGAQADFAGDRAAERQAGPVEDERLACPELSLGPAADPHRGRADWALAMISTSTATSSRSLSLMPTW
jgi:hypothetical protein